MGNVQAYASWFDVLSWIIRLCIYMYVLKLCVWSSSWAICKPQLHGLMFCHVLYVLGLCMKCLMPYAETLASWFGVL